MPAADERLPDQLRRRRGDDPRGDDPRGDAAARDDGDVLVDLRGDGGSPTAFASCDAASRAFACLPDAADEAARVRLAASWETASDVLSLLAHDRLPTVRAAIAMNGAVPAAIDAMLAADPDERVRALLARKLAGLLPSLPLSDRHAVGAHAMGVLASLVEDEATRVRAAIAEIVLDMPQAPRSLILRLAQDAELTVSEPVIRLSPLLTVEDLLALVANPASATTTTSVARRPRLQAEICDAIAATADSLAIRALLENPSAAIREATIDVLVARAADEQDWHGPLVRRPALSARAAHALADMVANDLLAVLAERADLDAETTRVLRRRLDERLRHPVGAPPARLMTLEQAVAEARVLEEEDQLTEATLLGAIGRGERALATALLALAAGLPVAAVERAVLLRSAKALISVVWRSGFSMTAATAVQTELGHIAPAGVIGATASGGFPLAVAEMRWQIELLARHCRP